MGEGMEMRREGEEQGLKTIRNCGKKAKQDGD
jgi:hypothetical protein